MKCPLTFKGSVSRILRWVLLYINQKLFSSSIVAHHKILILLKGYFAIYKNKIQRMNVPTILDGLHNSRCGNHDHWGYFLSGDILIKLYGRDGTAKSRITLLRFFKGNLIFIYFIILSSRIRVKVMP